MGLSLEADTDISVVSKPVVLRLCLGEFCFSKVLIPARIFDIFSIATEPLPPIKKWTDRLSNPEAIFVGGWPIETKLTRLHFEAGYIRYVVAQEQRHYVALTGTFDQYLQRFSKNSRHTLRKNQKKLTEFCNGKESVREYRLSTDIEDFCTNARAISVTTYQHRLLSIGIPESQEFLDRLKTEAAADRFRGYILFDDMKPVAFLLCSIVAGGRWVIGERTGYDPAYSSFSPGNMIRLAAFEHLWKQNFSIYDFGIGKGPHKTFFGTGQYLSADVLYLPYSARNLGIVLLHNGLATFSRAVVLLLDKINIKSWIKKRLRRAAKLNA